MVSEFMLQQTPVERVRGPWQAWMDRWPTPDALAAAPAGEAVRAWGRLGYPRRALRLHQAAVIITERFDGQVPADRDALLSLPGVGSLHGGGDRQLRVRAAGDRAGHQRAPGAGPGGVRPRPTRRRRRPRARSPSPSGWPLGIRAVAARWAVASMELGAVVCVARSPTLRRLPGPRPLRLAGRRLARLDRAAAPGPGVRGHRPAVPGRPAGRAALQRRAGRRRRARGRLARRGPAGAGLASLIADGLVVATADRWSLPG